MVGPRQPTVLLVDADETNRQAISWLLRNAGFAVQEAASGSEALRMVGEQPDLVVLDVNLPDIDGFEVCRWIKTHPATTTIPVVHLSGVYVRPQDKMRALAEGADAYLTKPVQPEDLISQALTLARNQDAAEETRQREEVIQDPQARRRAGLMKQEAEDLLDWLEANGYSERKLDYEEGRGFVVRWRAR